MTNLVQSPDFDAVVIGAGFSGLGMLRRLRDELDMSVQVYEAGSEVGGTWYWNRYPGARCDSESYTYCFLFSKELLQDWEWSGKYPEQPEILSYLNHVADRFDLRPNIRFNTRVNAARFMEDTNQWEVETDQGDRVTTRFLITGIGCISAGNVPDIKGLDSFLGEWYHTGSWPHEKVEFAGKRVAVIGTGSSGVQSIPVIAEQAEHLTVFQRTAQYSIPACHQTADRRFIEEEVKPHYDEIVGRMKLTGVLVDQDERSALEVTAEERRERYEAAWAEGGHKFVAGSFRDVMTDIRANDTLSEFIRSKIREIVKDPETLKKLLPTDHPLGSKRILIDTNYFETYNRDNVDLVDIRHSPIQEITPTGIRTEDQEYELDIIVFATGFDAMTGYLLQNGYPGQKRFVAQRQVVRGAEDLLGRTDRRIPQYVHDNRAGQPLGLHQHARVHRPARGVDLRLP